MTTCQVSLFSPGNRIVLICAALCWLLAAASCAGAENSKPTEYQVKAAFLFNFARFVEWPDSAFAGPAAPFVFCILGADPFGSDIDAVTGRTVNNRKTQVRRLQEPGEARGCHLLFISKSGQDSFDANLKTLEKSGMLLVGETAGFAARGGMINFIIHDNTVGFEINVGAAARAGFTLHSRLLNMADIVHDSQYSGDE